jgi:uncharacterized protein YkwD
MALIRILCGAFAAACVLGGAAPALACTGTDAVPTGATMAQARGATLCLINEARRAHGLSTLQPVARLRQAALGHSRAMVAEAYFAHEDPDGSTPVSRIRDTGYLRAARRWSVGETIAWGTGGLGSPRAIVRAWMNSPPHRHILLSGRFRDIGVGIVLGNPQGAGGATVTADLGMRR